MSSPSEKKLLVVLGITGIQGGSVANAYLSSPEWRIRGMTRSPSKPSNASLISAGVELVEGDMNDQASLEKAFHGADAIFAVTDFWQPLLTSNSPIFAEAEKQNRLPNELAMELEIQQGKNIVNAAAKAHAEKPLQRLVVSTLTDSNKWSKGEIKWNLHYDGKDRYVQYLKTSFPDLAKVTSYIHVGWYLSNFFTFNVWTSRKDANGEYVFQTVGVETEIPAKIPYLDAGNDIGYMVRALIETAPPQTTMLGYSKNLTIEEFGALWAETLGVTKPKIYHTSAEDLTKAGMPDWMAAELVDTGKFVSKYGWTGGEEGVKGPEECGVEMGKLTDIPSWIRAQDWKL